MAARDMIETDLLIVGGGLAGGLIALALARLRPDIAVTIVEGDARLGGNHVWSFFDGDVAAGDRWLVDSLISHRWPAYDVAFPAHRRTIAQAYHAIESERFDAALRAAVPPARIVRAEAVAVAPDRVVLADQSVLRARGVIDTRGAGDLATLDAGWQKFVGRLLAVEGGHGIERPVVMDATVAQIDGYRFVYLLPFDATHIFVEDTYYSDSPVLDRAAIVARIDAYAAARGWRVAGCSREETGVLPVIVKGDFDAYWASTGADVAKAGARAGLFHATTGYSLPDAVRLAIRIAGLADFSGAGLAQATWEHARVAWRGRGFYRLLDTMLFRAAGPDERYRIMERFYRLDPSLIGRFYAARSTRLDKLRIVLGKPPIPIPRALGAILRTWAR